MDIKITKHITIKIRTSLWKHFILYYNNQPIFVSGKDTADINNKKVTWIKLEEKERLLNFLKIYYPNEHKHVIGYV